MSAWHDQRVRAETKALPALANYLILYIQRQGEVQRDLYIYY